MRILSSFVLVGLLVFPAIGMASSVVRTGETVAVAADQSVEGDFYGFGGTSAVSGTVRGDLLLLSGAVTMNGSVEADVFVVGGTVDVHGQVADDLRVVGGTVTVAGEVEGDLVVFASELNVLSTATIAGDILFFGGRAEVAGAVGKDVLGTSDVLRIDGPVGGRVDVTTRALTLGDRTSVAGDVSYTAPQEVVRAQNAEVKGKLVRSDMVTDEAANYRSVAISFLVILFAALLLQLIFRSFVERVVVIALDRPFRASAFGFAVLFLAPLVASVLVLSTLGAIVGATLLFVYAALLCLSIPVAGIVAGSYVVRVYRRSSSQISVLAAAIGVGLVTVCLYIPLIGPLLLLSTLLVALGAIAQHVYRTIRQ